MEEQTDLIMLKKLLLKYAPILRFRWGHPPSPRLRVRQRDRVPREASGRVHVQAAHRSVRTIPKKRTSFSYQVSLFDWQILIIKFVKMSKMERIVSVAAYYSFFPLSISISNLMMKSDQKQLSSGGSLREGSDFFCFLRNRIEKIHLRDKSFYSPFCSVLYSGKSLFSILLKSHDLVFPECFPTRHTRMTNFNFESKHGIRQTYREKFSLKRLLTI